MGTALQRWVPVLLAARHGEQGEDEYISLDHGGRLQIQQAFIDELALKDRVHLQMNGDQIVIRRA